MEVKIAGPRLDPGQFPILDHFYMVIKEHRDDGLLMYPVGSTEAPRLYENATLLDMAKNGRLRFGQFEWATSKSDKGLDAEIETIDPRWRAEAHRRLDYVKACDDIFGAPASQREHKMRPDDFAKIAIEVWLNRINHTPHASPSHNKRPGGSTLRSWYQRWIKGERQILALVPYHSKKGDPTRTTTDPRVETVIRTVVKKHWLRLHRPSVTHIYTIICAELKDLRQAHPTASDYLADPSIATVYRWIKKNIEPYEAMAKRHGKSQADATYKQSRKAPDVRRLLEHVEMDSTKLDIMLLRNPTSSDPKVRYGRATLLVLIDKASRMVLGFDISFGEVNTAALMRTWRMAFLQKESPGRFGKTEWPAFGIPETIVTDNWSTFHCASAREAALQLGIDLRFCAPGQPQLKGIVERFFGEVARGFARVPGCTFANTKELGTIRPEDHAFLTLEKLRERFTIWIRDIYHNHSHRGLREGTPLQAWRKLSIHSVRYPPSDAELSTALSCLAFGAVQKRGISNFGLYYQSDELHALAARADAPEKFKFKYLPDDLSQINVFDPFETKWLSVYCRDQELTKGLTLDMWREIKLRARYATARDSAVAKETLLEARSSLEREIPGPLKTKRKTKRNLQPTAAKEATEMQQISSTFAASIADEVNDRDQDFSEDETGFAVPLFEPDGLDALSGKTSEVDPDDVDDGSSIGWG